MKKLGLLFILVIAGLVAVAQENNHLVQRRDMERDDENLCFIQGDVKEVISETELLQLLDDNDYEKYQKGRALYLVGDGIKKGGWIAFGTGLGVAIMGLMSGGGYEGEDGGGGSVVGNLLTVAGLSAYMAGWGLIPTGYILRGIGAGRISSVADEYNDNHRIKYISYQLSPTVMPVSGPLSQNKLAYGMTFSIQF